MISLSTQFHAYTLHSEKYGINCIGESKYIIEHFFSCKSSCCQTLISFYYLFIEFYYIYRFCHFWIPMSCYFAGLHKHTESSVIYIYIYKQTIKSIKHEKYAKIFEIYECCYMIVNIWIYDKHLHTHVSMYMNMYAYVSVCTYKISTVQATRYYTYIHKKNHTKTSIRTCFCCMVVYMLLYLQQKQKHLIRLNHVMELRQNELRLDHDHIYNLHTTTHIYMQQYKWKHLSFQINQVNTYAVFQLC